MYYINDRQYTHKQVWVLHSTLTTTGWTLQMTLPGKHCPHGVFTPVVRVRAHVYDHDHVRVHVHDHDPDCAHVLMWHARTCTSRLAVARVLQ